MEKPTTPADVPIQQVVKVPTTWLRLDRSNPRFTPGKMPVSLDDVGIIGNLALTADLNELIQSISQNGFIDVEPLIVQLESEFLTVLEGNRRLAAVNVLLDPDLASRVKIQVPPLPPQHRPSLEELPIYRVERRVDAEAIIGFKHINGPRAWDSYAKAEFAANWLSREVDKKDGITLREIAERMGDSNNTLRRMVHAIFVLRQAATAGIWTIDDRSTKSFAFSHLYTGLSYPTFAEFLGIEPFAPSDDPKPDPVPREKYDALRMLLSWLYGDSRAEEEPIIETQAKDLGRIRDVLGSREAIAQIIAQRSLDDAYITAQPKGELFRKNLFDSKRSLEKALSSVGGFDPIADRDLISTAVEVRNSARRLESLMQSEVSGSEE